MDGFLIFLGLCVIADAYLFEKGYKSLFFKRDKDEPNPQKSPCKSDLELMSQVISGGKLMDCSIAKFQDLIHVGNITEGWSIHFKFTRDGMLEDIRVVEHD